ncbi:hypothetical protein JW848_00700 [Candidatus Bipolaricaulota bacterium]|nr:hypothetical protein [Candidatus Bipolaricaulota bacterium]
MSTRSFSKWAAIAVLMVAVGVVGWADIESDTDPVAFSMPDFGGVIAFDVSLTPVPPLSYDIAAQLSLDARLGWFSLSSETQFSLSGFEFERLILGAALGAIMLTERLDFDPLFAWNQLGMDVEFLGIALGVDLILADISTAPPSVYSMAGILEFETSFDFGVSVLSLTGFGATDLLESHQASATPLAADLLGLLDHVDGLCVDEEAPNPTILPGFYFEEQDLQFSFSALGLLVSSTTEFSWTGISRQTIEFGFQFADPQIAFLLALSLDIPIAVDEIVLLVDLQVFPVRFTSHTVFAAPLPPTLLPIQFESQRFGLGMEFLGALWTTVLDFDSTFLFERLQIGIEAEIGPAMITSLTTFAAAGFQEQCLRANVTFSGITLSTSVRFDMSGLVELAFGFALSF